MKNLLVSSRSKYIVALVIFAIGIGVISKKVLSDPSECIPVKIKFNLKYILYPISLFD